MGVEKLVGVPEGDKLDEFVMDYLHSHGYNHLKHSGMSRKDVYPLLRFATRKPGEAWDIRFKNAAEKLDYVLENGTDSDERSTFHMDNVLDENLVRGSDLAKGQLGLERNEVTYASRGFYNKKISQMSVDGKERTPLLGRIAKLYNPKIGWTSEKLEENKLYQRDIVIVYDPAKMEHIKGTQHDDIYKAKTTFQDALIGVFVDERLQKKYAQKHPGKV